VVCAFSGHANALDVQIRFFASGSGCHAASTNAYGDPIAMAVDQLVFSVWSMIICYYFDVLRFDPPSADALCPADMIP
jgi:hypothetical protein